MSDNKPLPETMPAEVFTTLARTVYARATYDDIYTAIVKTAVDLIPGCDHACVSVLRAGEKLGCVASNDEVARRIDQLESETGEGPCLDAILEASYQHDPDIARHSTWPALTQRVLEETPVRGMIGYRIIVGGQKAGALNVFSDGPGALTDRSADMGAIVAAFASTALAGASHHERAEQLQQGLESNREIGKAVGLLMATHQIRDDEAFEVLRRASSEMNVKLAEIARRVVEDHNDAR